MKIYLDMVGCRLNQAELERMAVEYIAHGHELVESAEDADIAVLNTCSVTSAASADSRQMVRRTIRKGARIVYATGCWATVDFSQAQEILPDTQIVNNKLKNQLVIKSLSGEPEIKSQISMRVPIPGKRHKTRAFIKVQDGCDQFCTYCVTRIARGNSISIPVKQVLMETQQAIDAGCHEIVLCGVSLGAWGKDFAKGNRFSELVQALLDKTKIERIRFSSLEPWDITPEMINLFEDPRLCRHLHLPLQSGSDSVLKRMNRPIDTRRYRAVVEMVNSRLPDAAITTDIIVGFPGEDEMLYKEGLKFIDSLPFAGGHVFPFSAREHTPAFSMTNQISSLTKKERAETVRALFFEKQKIFRATFTHQSRMVLWENAKGSAQDGKVFIDGLTDNYIHVQTVGDRSMVNTISNFVIDED